MYKILFITQNLARTGSEMVLFYLLQHLDPKKYAVHVFCFTKGELYEALPEHIQKSVKFAKDTSLPEKLLLRILKKFKKDPLTYQLNNIQKRFNADMWFINTISVPDLFWLAKEHRVRVVTYVHELLYAFTFINQQTMHNLIAGSDVCIGCSEEVCERISEMGHKNIRLQHSFIDVNLIRPDWAKVNLFKEKFGFLSGDFIWVISAKTTYMKGLDYIIPILEYFKDQPVKILWIGNEENTGLEYYVKETSRLKYPGKLIFAGAQSEDYYNYLALGNGLLLLSREESFSLVLIEAANLGIPMVSFDVGIARKFIREGAGFVVENRNLLQLLEAMKKIQHGAAPDKEQLSLMSMEYTVERQLPKFENILDGLL
ncbi:glycosyltransferase family 4 protein [Pedobacter sp. AW31-3R]|uniref:glycosyltransferase family 4 protein n=1 Tax=Pedobacter sp. AW31-3R TaxID=3445781 RepID=UPI003FA0318A